MQVLLVLLGLAAAGGGCLLLGTGRTINHTGRAAAIGLATSGFVVATAAMLAGGEGGRNEADGSQDDDAGGSVEVPDPGPADWSTTSEPVGTETTVGTAPQGQATTSTELDVGTTAPPVEPENISIIPECFDRYHGEEPAVTAHDYRLVVDNDDQRTSEPIPSGRPVALFVVQAGEVVGSVRFEYSSNDTLTVYDAVDEVCDPVPWDQTGTELRRSTIAVSFARAAHYEITFAFGLSFDDRTATIHTLEQ